MAEYYQIVYSVLNRLQMLNLIEFNQESDTLIFAKILICIFGAD